MFLDPLAMTLYDEVHSAQEDRWHTIGNDAEGKLITVSHTIHEIGQARMRVRLISAREATRDERRFFENEPR